jgi:hypothetical protein
MRVSFIMLNFSPSLCQNTGTAQMTYLFSVSLLTVTGMLFLLFVHQIQNDNAAEKYSREIAEV